MASRASVKGCSPVVPQPKRLVLSALMLASFASVSVTGCSRPISSTTGQTGAGRFEIVQIGGDNEAAPVMVKMDTQTGETWQLLPLHPHKTAPEHGWHPIPHLTIESRTPYYPGDALRRSGVPTDGEGG